jgi:hypothetical protein
VTIKDLILRRQYVGNNNNLFGQLDILTDVGHFQWSTIENTQYAIPTGKYPILYTYSPRFKRSMLELEVPNRKGIRIHAANRGSELRGCIAIGVLNITDEISDQIYFSKDSTDQVELLLWQKKDLTLKIYNPYDNEKRNIIKAGAERFTEAFRFGG